MHFFNKWNACNYTCLTYFICTTCAIGSLFSKICFVCSRKGLTCDWPFRLWELCVDLGCWDEWERFWVILVVVYFEMACVDSVSRMPIGSLSLLGTVVFFRIAWRQFSKLKGWLCVRGKSEVLSLFHGITCVFILDCEKCWGFLW